MVRVERGLLVSRSSLVVPALAEAALLRCLYTHNVQPQRQLRSAHGLLQLLCRWYQGTKLQATLPGRHCEYHLLWKVQTFPSLQQF